jgi:hypothetical protein
MPWTLLAIIFDAAVIIGLALSGQWTVIIGVGVGIVLVTTLLWGFMAEMNGY